jgi:hypothetical protein
MGMVAEAKGGAGVENTGTIPAPTRREPAYTLS